MLQLTDIVKSYKTGDTSVQALKGVSIAFRDNEFVSILGQSGCGKTTLLNIIGGLDRYDSGDLAISGRSTKEFDDSDWDSYRNHSIGFVFQSYNLIPHQTVLSNVELALTLSGVSKSERKKRAAEALAKVGLGDQLNKKPNQMSGGQMQRVAIARALVNDPEILLADEPTGALDSETSVQIMDILKEVAQDRLVIMVTHNPELAEQYSTRIVRLLDGKVIDDTDPVEVQEVVPEQVTKAERKKQKKAEKKRKKKERTSMSFLTALSLSTNNLLTKKGRTFMTSFAGSIGIIGIALILSLSNGFQIYIDNVQQDALSTYPLTIEKETLDLSSLLESMAKANKEDKHDRDQIYSNPVMTGMMDIFSSDITSNDLESFKKFIENEENGVLELLSTPPQYGYNFDLNVYKPEVKDGIVQISPDNVLTQLMSSFSGGGSGNGSSNGNSMGGFGAMQGGGMRVWSEMIDNQEMLDDQYDVLAGKWPQKYNELVLVADKNNELTDIAMYALGILDEEELMSIISTLMNGEEYEAQVHSFSYDSILDTTYSLIIPADYFVKDEETGKWVDMRDDDIYMNELVASAEKLKIVGIVRPSDEATATSISSPIAYTHELTEYLIAETSKRDIVKEQLADKETDVFTGLTFKKVEEQRKIAEAANAEKTEEEVAEETTVSGVSTGALNPEVGTLAAAGTPEVVGVAKTMTEAEVSQYIDANVPAGDRQMMHDFVDLFLKGSRTLKERKQLIEYLDKLLANYQVEGVGKISGEQAYMALNVMSKEKKLEMLTAMITGDASSLQGDIPAQGENPEESALEEPEEPKEQAAESYEVNARLLGIADMDSPDRINLYPIDFEAKEKISKIIEDYNEKEREAGNEDGVIDYTDYIGIFLSSVTTIINVVSYVLIAFVAISLVVSSIMIGIITYISVLERTKEIGILRSIGASKKDISRVFNAETLIVGLAAGVIGIGVTLLMNIPINIIIKALVDISNVSRLPVGGAIALIMISVLLTVIAGLIPSRFAAKKDPVEALRTE